MPDPRVASREITRIRAAGAALENDEIVVERPLEIAVDGRNIAVTLRTPGDDRVLALGFLAGEGLVQRREQIRDVSCVAADCVDRPDRVEVALAPGVRFDWSRLERHFAATAACGLCGRAHLDALRTGLAPLPPSTSHRAADLLALPERLSERQHAFRRTGGLHAAVWLDDALNPRASHEDVGRHNAVDKVAGALVDDGRYPVGGGVLWVSGRAGAEIVLKAARAAIPVFVAVGAPSSLAVEIAEAARMTLAGFVRDGRMNLYAGPERVRL